jgi:O-antigen ligase
MRRVAGALGHPNLLAEYLAMLLAPALSLTMTNLPFRFKVLGVSAFGWGAWAILLTMSRGGLLALVVSTILFCVAASRQRKSLLAVPCFVSAAVLLFGFYTGFGSRFSDDGGAAAARVPLAFTALEIIRDHPLLGIGADNFTTVVGHYAYVRTFRGDWLATVHNKYLLVWSETGLIGLAAFLWLLTSSLRASWRGWKRRDPLFAPLYLGFGVALAGEMVQMAVEPFNMRSSVQLLLLIVALLVAMEAQEITAACRDARQDRSCAYTFVGRD